MCTSGGAYVSVKGFLLGVNEVEDDLSRTISNKDIGNQQMHIAVRCLKTDQRWCRVTCREDGKPRNGLMQAERVQRLCDDEASR